jgi:iron complex outermembrane receptor protein
MKNYTTRIFIALICGGGIAQAAEEAAPGKEREPLAEVIVTGSSIPTASDEVTSPVSIVGQEQIQQSGINSNMLEILRKTLPAFAGRSNTGNSNANNTNQNTGGGSQIQLRNLDTLVLINGRRVANSGINGIGGKNFVDVNQIPAAAIDRIEVLTDGASAIYGSDAIGGVVNIILKSNYRGAEVGGRYGAASGGGNYGERSGYFVAGGEAHDVSFTLTGSWSKTDPLFQNERPFASPLTGRVSAIPGAVGAGGLNPGALLATTLSSPSQTNPTGTAATASSVAQLIANGTYLSSTPAAVASTFDLSQFQTLLLEQDQKSGIASFTADLVEDRLTAFGDLMYSKTKSFTQFLPLSTSVTVPAGAPFNPLTTAFPQVFFAYLPAPKQFFNDATGARATLGLQGEITSKWNWETAYVYSESKITQEQRNVFYAPNIARAIAGGFDVNGNAVAGGRFSRVVSGFSETGPLVTQPALDPFARTAGVDPASIANLYGTEVIDAKSQLQSIDAKVTGALWDLPAGHIGVALGLNYRREELSGQTDPNGYNTGPTNHRWSGATFVDPFSRTRSIKAAFAETRVPITSSEHPLPGVNALDLIAAVRAERYSDAGDSTVPKLGFRWQPFDSQLTVRGTYSKAFTAPTLFAMFGPTGTRLIGTGVIQTVFGLTGLAFNGEDGNNPQLKPSLAWSRSLGVVIAPNAVKGLRVTADYVSVNQSGFPGGIGFTNILASVDKFGSASPFSNNLALNNFPGRAGATSFANPGDLGNYLRGGGNSLNLYAVDFFVNLAELRVRALDASIQYDVATDRLGEFSFGTAGTWFDSYQFKALPDQSFYEYAGFATNGGTGVQGTLPKYRLYTTAGWHAHSWDATVGNTYVASTTDIGPGGIVFATSTTLRPLHVDRYVTTDLQLGYTLGGDTGHIGHYFKRVRFTVGANNVFNRMPPASPQAFTDNNVDVATFSPLGRLVFGTVEAKF